MRRKSLSRNRKRRQPRRDSGGFPPRKAPDVAKRPAHRAVGLLTAALRIWELFKSIVELAASWGT
jgi:hypothetical protein